MNSIDDNGIWLMDGHVSILVAQTENEDRISVLRHTVPFNEAPPLHIHHDEEEIFQILNGRMRFKKADEVFEASVGETIFLPRGVPHGFRVISEEGAVFLTITRGPFENMVRAAGRPALHPGLPEPTAMTPELQRHFAKLCGDNRVELIGPPID